ncbi:hypothetical protein BHU72_08810 [Desulfuribacillus stibiiarsenatis]|uniref:YitT family protein n=1 Tax=Desulfuribacillus stibiiarsenatis TaxID=1390249 RepID=A0A1E5L3A9_9FIRM|nr:hypothetical protein [Desulfuribacillus stibiiarsenatis]OEH84587.1 hypothetical protein BHU72_08810 [Desulfuribacillus stibiiarsenatis]
MIFLKRLVCSWLVFFLGIAIMSYGIVLTIIANLGVSPWDVFHIGVAKVTPLTVGMVVQMTGILIIFIVSYMIKRLPQIGTILNMIFVGLFVDFFLMYPLIVLPIGYLQQFIVLIIGILLFGFGAGLYISSHLGAGPRDGLVLVLHSVRGWPVSRIKTVMEISALIVGLILGGPIGIGTVIISFTIGPVLGFSLVFCESHIGKYLGEGQAHEVIN